MSEALVVAPGARLALLGDVHGRWAATRRALAAAGLVDAAGRWAAPAGTTLVQVGDLVDRGRSPGPGDPAAELAAVRDRLPPDAAVACPRAPDRVRPLGDVVRGPPGWPAALLAVERLALLGALDVLATLRAFRTLAAEAAAAGGRVVCLLGNHDLDLLRGAFRYEAREKAYLLALLGVDPAVARRHAAAGGATDAVAAAAPELAWLTGRPLMARAGDVLCVHGGPTRAALAELAGRGVRDLEGVAAWLGAARARGLDDPAFAEGASLFSPDAPADDAVADPGLAWRLLDLTGARVLAVGHSPFLHRPKGRWLDLRDPAARADVERPLRLGPLLKLDTNQKRGGPAWVVLGDAAGWRAVRDDGSRGVLAGPEPGAADDDRGGPPEGVAADALRRLERTLADGGPAAAATRALLGPLLALGLSDLAPLEAAAAAPAADAPAVAAARALLAAAEARTAELAAQAVAAAAPGPTAPLLAPTPAECAVRGVAFHLGPAAAARAVADGLEAAVGAVAFSRAGAPWLRIERHERGGRPREASHPLAGWPPDAAEVARLAADLRNAPGGDVGADAPSAPPTPTGAPGAVPGPTAPRPAPPRLRPGAPLGGALGEACRAWVALNRDHLPAADAPWTIRALTRAGRPLAARALPVSGDLRGPPLLTLPDGGVVPANTSLVDPAARFRVVGVDGAPIEHPRRLLDLLEPREGPVRLDVAASAEVEAILRLGELDALGRGGAGPPWRRGPFLFASPHPAVREVFAGKDTLLHFRLGRAALADAVAAGLLNVNAFLTDRGEAIDPDARLGAPDAGLEVVALGAAGVAWLLRHEAT